MILAEFLVKLELTGEGCTAMTSTPCGCASAACSPVWGGEGEGLS